MNILTHHSIGNKIRLMFMAGLIVVLSLGTAQTARAAAGPAAVNLGEAAHFAILTKAGITNIPTSDITGDLGVSPITYASITGFSLVPIVPDGSNTFATSAQVTGKIYASDYTEPTPTNLITAISNMQTAYADAAGRPLPDYTELYSGDISGQVLIPGLYKWGTDVSFTSDVTLSGPADAVWVFQISGDLIVGSGAKVLLSGGAQSKNIFWQVGGGTGVEMGTTSHLEGTILAAKAIHLRTGASLNGRALSQTEVTLDQNIVVIPAFTQNQTAMFTSVGSFDGWVLESSENSNIGGTRDSASSVLILGDDAVNKQYRSILHFNTSNLPNNAVIVSVTLMIYSQKTIGIDPFTTHGNLLVDVRKPFLGTTSDLIKSDFQTGANISGVGAFNVTPLGNCYTAVLNSVAYPFVNLTGTTQFRLRSIDDNNDLGADYIKFFSGNNLTNVRPHLMITYYLP